MHEGKADRFSDQPRPQYANDSQQPTHMRRETVSGRISRSLPVVYPDTPSGCIVRSKIQAPTHLM